MTRLAERPDYSRNLTDLEEMTVRISEECPYLASPVVGGRQELCSSLDQCLICGVTVLNPDGERVRDSRRVIWRCEAHSWLVLGRLTTCHHQQPRAIEVEHRRGASVLPRELGTKNVPIPRNRGIDIADYQDVSQLHVRSWKRAHRFPATIDVWRPALV